LRCWYASNYGVCSAQRPRRELVLKRSADARLLDADWSYRTNIDRGWATYRDPTMGLWHPRDEAVRILEAACGPVRRISVTSRIKRNEMGRVVLKEFRNRPIRWARNALDWSGIGVHQIDRLTRYPRSSLTSLEPVLIFGPFGIAASSPPSYHCLGRGAAVAILAGGRCFPTAPDASISRGQKLEPDRNGAGSGKISPSNPNG